MKNDKYVRNQWIKTLIIIIPIFTLMILAMIHNTTNRITIIGCVLFAIFIKFWIKRSNKQKIEKYFKNESPEQLLNYYDKVLNNSKSLQDKDVWICYNKSLVYCYYGEFENALELINKIDWDNRVPILQSLELSIRVIICYLRDENYQEGLRLSFISKELGQISKNVPGKSKSNNSYDIFIEIGEALSGNNEERIMKSLETKFKKADFYPKILIAWCLSNLYSRLDRVEESIFMLDYCKKAGPFCKPLHKVTK